MPGEVELCEDHEPEVEPDHRFAVPAKKVMIALVVGLTVSLLATAFSYTHFKGENSQLRGSLREALEANERRAESGISIELTDRGVVYHCVDEGFTGEYVCVTE